MNKITFEYDFNIKRLRELMGFNYPDCDRNPITEHEAHSLKIGTPCYVISALGPRLMMFLGKDRNEKFVFCCHNGTYSFNTRNVGKTYNIFRAYLS